MIYQGGTINKTDLKLILETNPGLIIFKFGAEWCGPCKTIEPLVKQRMERLPKEALCFLIDIDNSIELYGFLKNKKVIHGIPALLAYHHGNYHYIPDEFTVGADVQQVNTFFNNCELFLKSL